MPYHVIQELISLAWFVMHCFSPDIIEAIHGSEGRFMFEVVDGQHYLALYLKFLNADKGLPDYGLRQMRAAQMQSSHMAKIFVSSNTHGKKYWTRSISALIEYVDNDVTHAASFQYSNWQCLWSDSTCLSLIFFTAYLWLSHQLNLRNTLLNESADRCGFSKALASIRNTWIGKYKRHDISQERFAVVSHRRDIVIFPMY